MTITCNSYQTYNDCVRHPFTLNRTRLVAHTISKTASRTLVNLLTQMQILSHECHILPMRHCPRPLVDVYRPVLIPLVPTISIIRNPVNRLVSEFAYRNKLKTITPMYASSLHAFMNEPYRYNWQVGVLSGVRWSAQSVPNALPVALKNLADVEARVEKRLLLLADFEHLEDSIRSILESVLHVPKERIKAAKADRRRVPLLPQSNVTWLQAVYSERHRLDRRLQTFAFPKRKRG